MKKTEYLTDKVFVITVFLCSMILSAGILWMIEVKPVFIVFFEGIWFVAFLICLLRDYMRRKRHYTELWNIFDGLDDKTLFSEMISPSDFLDGSIMYQFIKCTDKYMNDHLAERDKEMSEYREYVEMWVHEIKTPITSARLIAENDKNMTTMRIDRELQGIEHFVEQALYYARSTSLEKDFKVEQTTLKELAGAAVKKYSKSIIMVKGQVVFENVDFPVLADRKWCAFIIGQIVANAVKYRKDSLVVTFAGGAYEGGYYLDVSDNGIGIDEAELPRIFDKGFTGTNGREHTKSTGIGLYLCRKLCMKMGMDISAQSVLGKGTVITLFFPDNSYLVRQM